MKAKWGRIQRSQENAEKYEIRTKAEDCGQWKFPSLFSKPITKMWSIIIYQHITHFTFAKKWKSPFVSHFFKKNSIRLTLLFIFLLFLNEICS